VHCVAHSSPTHNGVVDPSRNGIQRIPLDGHLGEYLYIWRMNDKQARERIARYARTITNPFAMRTLDSLAAARYPVGMGPLLKLGYRSLKEKCYTTEGDAEHLRREAAALELLRLGEESTITSSEACELSDAVISLCADGAMSCGVFVTGGLIAAFLSCELPWPRGGPLIPHAVSPVQLGYFLQSNPRLFACYAWDQS
jgi:hypothetical protein